MLRNWKPAVPPILHHRTDKFRILKQPGTDKFNIRSFLESADEAEEESVWEFVKLKHSTLYPKHKNGMRLPKQKPLIPMTPVEIFQKPPRLIRRQIFFKNLARGDILYLRVENESYDSYKLLTLAKVVGCWKIDDLSIVMYLPKYEPEMKLLDCTLEIGSLIRAALCSCSLRERRLNVTLDNSIVKREFRALKLGKASESELPHFLGNPFLGISYTDYLFITSEFRLPNWTCQSAFICLDERALYSNFDLWNKKKYPQSRCLPHLKKNRQAQISRPHFLKGQYSFNQNMPHLALLQLKNALSLYADNVEALLLRGYIHFDLGNIRQAFIDTEQALRLDPACIAARSQMSTLLVSAAESHMEQGDETKAKESLAVAKQLDPSNEKTLLSFEEFKDKVNNNSNTQNQVNNNLNTEGEVNEIRNGMLYPESIAKVVREAYQDPIAIPSAYLACQKKKSKKHHRKRSRHHPHKSSKPKSPDPIFFPGRKSPIPPPPAYPWDSSQSQPRTVPSSLPNLNNQSLSTVSHDKTLVSPIHLPSQNLIMVQQKKPQCTEPFSREKPVNESIPLLHKKTSVSVHSTIPRNSSPVVPQIQSSIHYVHNQIPANCAMSSSPIQDVSELPNLDAHPDTIPAKDLHVAVLEDSGGSEPFQNFCVSLHESRSPPRSSRKSKSPIRNHRRSRSPPCRRRKSRSPPRRHHRSRSPPRRHRKSRSPPRAFRRCRSPPRVRHRSRSPIHKSRHLHRNFHRSRSPDVILRKSKSPSPEYHRNMSPSLERFRSSSSSPDHRRDRSPSPDHRRDRSPSPYRLKSRSPSPDLRRSRSPSPNFHKSRSPSPNRRSPSSDFSLPSPLSFIRRTKSPSPDLHRNVSPHPGLHRNRSPPRSFHRRSKSPPRAFRRNRAEPLVHHRSRSPPRVLQRNKSPSRVVRKTKSPTRSVRHRSRSPPKGIYISETEPMDLETREKLLHLLLKDTWGTPETSPSSKKVNIHGSERSTTFSSLVEGSPSTPNFGGGPSSSQRRSGAHCASERSPSWDLNEVSSNQDRRQISSDHVDEPYSNSRKLPENSLNQDYSKVSSERGLDEKSLSSAPGPSISSDLHLKARSKYCVATMKVEPKRRDVKLFRYPRTLTPNSETLFNRSPNQDRSIVSSEQGLSGISPSTDPVQPNLTKLPAKSSSQDAIKVSSKPSHLQNQCGPSPSDVEQLYRWYRVAHQDSRKVPEKSSGQNTIKVKSEPGPSGLSACSDLDKPDSIKQPEKSSISKLPSPHSPHGKSNKNIKDSEATNSNSRQLSGKSPGQNSSNMSLEDDSSVLSPYWNTFRSNPIMLSLSPPFQATEQGQQSRYTAPHMRCSIPAISGLNSRRLPAYSPPIRLPNPSLSNMPAIHNHVGQIPTIVKGRPSKKKK